jgi:phage terminase large subunit-like protein
MQDRHSWIDWLASQSETKRSEILADLSDEEVALLLNDWRFAARPDQLTPASAWRTWLILAGRGWGKTRTGAEFVIDEVKHNGAKRIALVGRTAADCRDVMVEGQSGILACSPPDFRPEYEPSKRRLTWPNGAVASTYSADKPDQLRGPQHDLAWADELAAWTRWDAWDQLQFGMRLGSNPRTVVTTTPRPLIALRRLADASDTYVTRGRTADNQHNLAASFISAIHDRYAGSTLGRQELEGELLSELPGALFSRQDIEAYRVKEHPELQRIVVAIDPATTSKDESDESGIVVVGVSGRDFYVLADLSTRATPEKVCRRAIQAYRDFHADRIVVESNQGGDTWRTILEGIDPSVATRSVHASRGKQARAEPVGARYEQGRVHHVGVFERLEDQLCNYVPAFVKESPDRLDALVWAVTDLDSSALPNLKIDVDSGYRGANVWI